MIAVINYGAGNTFNVLYALQQLGVQPILTNNVEELRAADKIIFPGVGHATYAMQQLIAHNIAAGTEFITLNIQPTNLTIEISPTVASVMMFLIVKYTD